MSPLAAQLQEFIRRIRIAEHDSLTMRRDLIGIRQNMRDAGAEAGGGVKVQVTRIKGNVIGGLTNFSANDEVPMPNTSLHVVGHTSGIDYGTYSLPTGAYSLGLVIDPSDASLDLYPFGPSSPRFDGATPLAYNRTIIRGQTNALLGMYPPAAPGYGYLLYSFSGTFACQYPVGPLAWTDSLIGSGTATATGFGTSGLSSVGGWVSACQLLDSFTSGPCPARAGVAGSFSMGLAGQAFIHYSTSGPTSGCPITAACPTNGNGVATYPGGAITAKSCPAFDLSAKFDATWTANDQMWHNSAAHTIRFYEP